MALPFRRASLVTAAVFCCLHSSSVIGQLSSVNGIGIGRNDGTNIVDSRLGVTPTGNRVTQTAVSCDERFIYFRVNFQRPFTGLVYTENAYPSCVYVNGSIQQQLAYDIRIPLQGCLTRQMPNLDYENAVIVQENPNLLESTDRKYLLTCVPGTSNSRDGTFTINFGGVTVKNTLTATEVVRGNGGGGGAALDYQVEIRRGAGPNGALVSGALNVGDVIAYVVRIPDLRGSDARIGRCWAQDGNSNIQLSDDRGCSVQTPGNVWNHFEELASGTGRIYYNNIKAWAFPTSNRVNIFCNLHVCPSECQEYKCGPRNRRSIVDVLLQRERRSWALTKIETDDDAKAVEKDNADLVETVQGGFSVLPSLAHTDALIADAQQQVVAPGVVTGVPHSYNDAVGADYTVAPNRPSSASAAPGRFCMDRAHFVAGVVLMSIVILLSIAFMVTFLYKLFTGGAGKPRQSHHRHFADFRSTSSNS